MEPHKDFVLVRDGDEATALELATLTGRQQEHGPISGWIMDILVDG